MENLNKINSTNHIFKSHRESIMDRPQNENEYMQSMLEKGVKTELDSLNKTIQMEFNGSAINANYDNEKELFEVELDMQNHIEQMELNEKSLLEQEKSLDRKELGNDISKDGRGFEFDLED